MHIDWTNGWELLIGEGEKDSHAVLYLCDTMEHVKIENDRHPNIAFFVIS